MSDQTICHITKSRGLAVVINSTPKYYWMLPATVGLLRRYGTAVLGSLYVATEEPDHPVIQYLVKEGVRVLDIGQENSDFFESRAAAIRLLPKEVEYVIPIQEDFLLERPGINFKELNSAIRMMDEDPYIASMRFMPSPPTSSNSSYWGKWVRNGPDDQAFSYQTTLWCRDLYLGYMEALINDTNAKHPNFTKAEYNQYAVRTNPAETHEGLPLLKEICGDRIHLCWARAGPWANAVYDCPWPYRPTAIKAGILEPWADELLRREGFAKLCYGFRT
jgi:hypothetical protein